MSLVHTSGKSLTAAQMRVLKTAASRETGFVCPTHGVYAAAQDALLKALRSKGYITESHSPVITEAGRAALEAFQQRQLDRFADLGVLKTERSL